MFGRKKQQSASVVSQDLARRGEYRGRHYTEWVEPVKREGRFDEAAQLLTDLLPVVEAESAAKRWQVAPWYYEQLAIIHRKQKEYAHEVGVLDRFQAANASHGGLTPELEHRLAKAQELLARSK